MSTKLEMLVQNLQSVLGDRVGVPEVDRGELTVDVAADQYLEVARNLRDNEKLAFAQLIDLSGIDYAEMAGWPRGRFGVAVHLLSIKHNWRLRLRVCAPDDELPVLPSLMDIWNGVNWYEREAFDMYGILFEGHPDLRRILTDYGFVGHPFRKDFPVSGHVEMRYDPEKKRIIYQPVTIAPRETSPRVVREANYGRGEGRA